MLGRALAIAALLAPIPFAGVAQADTFPDVGPGWKITVAGTLRAFSGVYIGTNYLHDAKFSHTFRVRGGKNSTQNYYFQTCAGGDTVSHVQITVRKTSDRGPEIRTVYKIYSGTCNRFESGLTGQDVLPYSKLPNSGSRDFRATAHPTPDYGGAYFTATSKWSLCCFL